MRVALNGLFLQQPSTGTGQYLREFVAAMRAQAPDVDLTFIAPFADPTAPAAVQVYPTTLRTENFAKLEFEQITFPRVTKNKFTLAHIPHFGPPLFPTLPTVVTIHDLIPIVLPAYRGSLGVRLYTRLAALGARRAKAVIADSYASARDIEKYLRIPQERIHVVHLAADARFSPPSPIEIQRVRDKYQLPEKFILYLGGFDVRKNVRRVIETFAALEERRAEWKLVLAGKVPEIDTPFFPNPHRIANEMRVLEDVNFIGLVAEEDKPGLYAAARAFLFPSHYEGFGLPPLEAMASGTPVISSDTSSLPEVVGNGGILLAPDDARGWSEALRALVRDDARRNELRVLGLNQAQQFSWQRTALQTLEVYRKVC